MRRAFLVLNILVLTASHISAQKPAEGQDQSEFVGPAVVAAGELVHPANSIAYGTIATEVTVGPTGKVESVRVIRDVVSLTSEAVRDVKAWKFKPATLAGTAVRAKVGVVLVFNPPDNNPANTPLPPITQDTEEQPPNGFFSPPKVTEVIYARYPIQSVAAGTVALEVKVDSSGQVGEVKVLRDIASLTPEAVRAIKNWKFEPATLNGREVPSTIVTAFLFTNPSSLGTPYY